MVLFCKLFMGQPS